MNKRFTTSLLEYLGKYEGGIIALISIIYDSKYYEGTFFYNETHVVLTPPLELEEVLGHSIIEDDEYKDMVKDIVKFVVPYKEMYNRLDDLDLDKYKEEDQD